MGGLCSRRANADSTTDHGIPHGNGHLSYGAGTVYQSRGLPIQLSSDPMPPAGESQQLTEPTLSYPEMNDISLGIPMDDVDDGIPILSRVLSNKSISARSKQVAIAKVSGQFHMLCYVLWL